MFLLMIFGSLFSVVNPFGTMPIFLGLTQDMEKSESSKVAFKSSLFMTIILLISFFAGQYVLSFFGITVVALRIAGGLIISISGFALLTGKFSQHKGIDKRVKDDAYTKEDPSMTPLSIPMLAGPGSMSFLISSYQDFPDSESHLMICAAIGLVGLCTYLILASSRMVNKAIGASGLRSLSRVIGFIVIAIGIQYVLGAITEYVEEFLA